MTDDYETEDVEEEGGREDVLDSETRRVFEASFRRHRAALERLAEL